MTMSEPHTVTLDELVAFATRYERVVFASSTKEDKRLECVVGNWRFFVKHGDKDVYEGAWPNEAVERYNAITGKP